MLIQAEGRLFVVMVVMMVVVLSLGVHRVVLAEDVEKIERPCEQILVSMLWLGLHNFVHKRLKVKPGVDFSEMV